MRKVLAAQNNEDIEHYFCGDCIHWKIGDGGRQCPCKRIDHNQVKFATPWFQSYDGNQHNGIICSDFYPRNKWDVETWQGFPKYWKLYVTQWLPYGKTNKLVYFTLHNDTSVRYGVHLMDFVYGTMIHGNRLNAVEKMYYKKRKVCERYPYGYELVREIINGVEIIEAQEEASKMGANIYIPAEDVWEFFQKNRSRLSEEMVAIAENKGTEYAVYLTEDNGYPLFSVCKGKLDPIFEEEAAGEKECAKTAEHCYTKYLFPAETNDNSVTQFSCLDDDNGDGVLSEQEMQDIVYEREDELRLAMADFMQVVLSEDFDGVDIIDQYGTNVIDELLDVILEYMATNLYIPVYRPMFLPDDKTTGKVYEEYPYEVTCKYR